MGRRIRSRVRKGQGASAICDRSGFRYPMSEMVEEPGTGFLVHKSETDGEYSMVEHPLNHINRYIQGKTGDPYPVINARPDPAYGEDVSSFSVEFDFSFEA